MASQNCKSGEGLALKQGLSGFTLVCLDYLYQTYATGLPLHVSLLFILGTEIKSMMLDLFSVFLMVRVAACLFKWVSVPLLGCPAALVEPF